MAPPVTTWVVARRLDVLHARSLAFQSPETPVPTYTVAAAHFPVTWRTGTGRVVQAECLPHAQAGSPCSESRRPVWWTLGRRAPRCLYFPELRPHRTASSRLPVSPSSCRPRACGASVLFRGRARRRVGTAEGRGRPMCPMEGVEGELRSSCEHAERASASGRHHSVPCAPATQCGRSVCSGGNESQQGTGTRTASV